MNGKVKNLCDGTVMVQDDAQFNENSTLDETARPVVCAMISRERISEKSLTSCLDVSLD